MITIFFLFLIVTFYFLQFYFQEDDSDLIRPIRQSVTISQRARSQGISAKYMTDKNQSKLSKIIKNRSEARMDAKCNSNELRQLMLEVLSK